MGRRLRGPGSARRAGTDRCRPPCLPPPGPGCEAGPVPSGHASTVTPARIPVDDAQAFVVWRIDLDGDGAEEALINATRSIGSPDSSTVLEGAYSVVLLQRASGSINGIYNNLFPQESQAFDHVEHTLFAALDLNGDGQLEIVLKSSYFESAELRIFGLRAGEIAQLLTAGCGV